MVTSLPGPGMRQIATGEGQTLTLKTAGPFLPTLSRFETQRTPPRKTIDRSQALLLATVTVTGTGRPGPVTGKEPPSAARLRVS